MKTRLILLSSLIFTGIFTAQTSIAAPSSDFYKVSIIVFQHTDNNGFNSEVWPSNPKHPNFDKAMDLQAINQANNLLQSLNTQPSRYYRALPPSQFGLSNALARMQKSGKYTIITTASWIQPLNSSKQAKTIHIYAGQAYDAQGNVIANPSTVPPQVVVDNSDNNNSDANPDVDNLTPQPTTPTTWQLNGTVKVSQSRFIVFDAHFLLTESVPVVNTDNSDDSPETRLTSFPLNQTIRTRGDEIHYLDNPVYGIIVYISKIK